MKRNEKFIHWLEKDAALPKTLRVISGYDVENLNRAETLMQKFLPYNAFQSYLFVDYASARALLFSHFFIQLYLKVSTYIVAFYLIALSYFLFAHHFIYSVALVGMGLFFILWYYKKLYSVYKEHVTIVNDARKNIKLKLFSSYILMLFQQFLQSAENKFAFIVNEYIYEFEKRVNEKINVLCKTFEKKIEELNNKIQSLISITDNKSNKTRINYNSSKKVLLFHFINHLSKTDDSTIDLKNLSSNNKMLSDIAHSAGCQLSTVRKNLKYFMDKKSFLSQTQKQLTDIKPMLEELTEHENYQNFRAFRSTVDSLIHAVNYKTNRLV